MTFKMRETYKPTINHPKEMLQMELYQVETTWRRETICKIWRLTKFFQAQIKVWWTKKSLIKTS